jgi:hypothetical protein
LRGERLFVTVEEMHDLGTYQKAARRILAQWRYIEGSARWERLYVIDPEMIDAVGELVAIADDDFPLQPMPELPFSNGR